MFRQGALRKRRQQAVENLGEAGETRQERPKSEVYEL